LAPFSSSSNHDDYLHLSTVGAIRGDLFEQTAMISSTLIPTQILKNISLPKPYYYFHMHTWWTSDGALTASIMMCHQAYKSSRNIIRGWIAVLVRSICDFIKSLKFEYGKITEKFILEYWCEKRDVIFIFAWRKRFNYYTNQYKNTLHYLKENTHSHLARRIIPSFTIHAFAYMWDLVSTMIIRTDLMNMSYWINSRVTE